MFFLLSALVFVPVLAACSQNTPSMTEQQNNNPSNSSEPMSTETEDDFPTGPITLVVGNAAGGGTDVNARIVAKYASEYIGQPIVISNKPGGAGTVGMVEILNAKPDGYTLGVPTSTPVSIQSNYEDVGFEHDSFDPVIQFYSVPNIIGIKADAEWQDYDEWLEYVKANPGEFSYGTAGIGSTAHLAVEALTDALDIELQHIPYDGAAPAITALMGGHVDGVVAANLADKIDAGTMRGIIALSENKIFEGIPSTHDLGIDVDISLFAGLVAPKGTPENRIQIIHDAFKKALDNTELQEEMMKLGYPTSYLGPEDFQNYISATADSTKKVLQKVGLIE